MNIRRLGQILVLCAVVSGCSTLQRDTVVQVSTIDALLAGVYDGHMPCSELLKHGDLGCGTFEGLDGEMIVLDGTVYQIKADGTMHTPPLSVKTPFAAVCRFHADESFPIGKMDFAGLQSLFDARLPNQNIYCAFRIKGSFAAMETRSVPAQKKPYPPLTEVTRHQPKFQMSNVSGTIVGFRSPPFAKGLGFPGYHLHFISDDRTKGGHILSFEMTGSQCEVDFCNQLFLILPKDNSDFAGVDLSKDRADDLKKAEK